MSYESKSLSNVAYFCTRNGKFESHKKLIYNTGGKIYPWAIRHECELFGPSTEFYANFEDAVYDFVALERKYN